jgi:hypothetical protein
MLYSIHITAETPANSEPLSPQVFADLVHSLALGLRLHVTEVRTTKVLSSHIATFRGPRKPRATAKPTSPSHSVE